MKVKIIVVIIILLLTISGYFLITSMNQKMNLKSNDNQQTSVEFLEQELTDENQDDQTEEEENTVHEVIYTDSGYSPSNLTIKLGDTVVFKNKSSSKIWTASAQHPSHAVYSGSQLQEHCPDLKNESFDQCKAEGPGTEWSFTFTKVGIWGYHNHVKASHFGRIVVE